MRDIEELLDALDEWKETRNLLNKQDCILGKEEADFVIRLIRDHIILIKKGK